MVRPLKAWLLACVLLSSGGWILSAARQLNGAGYLVALLAASPFFYWIWRSEKPVRRGNFLRKRFTRIFPAFFLLLSALAFLGAVLNWPYHVDAFGYRIPRVFHWLAEEQWHWIDSSDVRLNVVALLFEWLTAPLLLFTGTHKWIFLINFISFLFLPGLCFSVLWRLGVAKRTAYYWMWVLPAGFCYAMQAGSMATDAFAAVFALAAVDLALRAQQSGKVSDLWFSLMAAALLSGAKQSNLPLLLTWSLAAVPSFRLLITRPTGSVLVFAGCVLASFLPITYFNYIKTGSWAGFTAGRDFTPDSPFWGVVGNTFWVTFSNLLPPVFPWNDRWNAMMISFRASEWGEPFRSFETFGHTMRAASEQFSGVGFGVSWLVIITVLALLVRKARDERLRPAERRSTYFFLLRLSPWIGLVVFLAKVGINQNPRYLAPFYPLLLPLLLHPSAVTRVVRTKWWRSIALAVIGLSIFLVFMSRQRPPWPAVTIASALEERFPGVLLFRKVKNAYAFTPQIRKDLLPLLAKIPAEETVLGYAVRFGGTEVFLWERPDTKRVYRIRNSEEPGKVRKKGFRYVVVDRSALLNEGDVTIVNDYPSAREGTMTIEEWLRVYDAELVHEQEVKISPEAPPARCYLVRLK